MEHGKIKPKKKMAMGKMMGGGMSKKPMAYKKGGVLERFGKAAEEKVLDALKKMGKSGKMYTRDMAKTRKNKK